MLRRGNRPARPGAQTGGQANGSCTSIGGIMRARTHTHTHLHETFTCKTQHHEHGGDTTKSHMLYQPCHVSHASGLTSNVIILAAAHFFINSHYNETLSHLVGHTFATIRVQHGLVNRFSRCETTLFCGILNKAKEVPINWHMLVEVASRQP